MNGYFRHLKRGTVYRTLGSIPILGNDVYGEGAAFSVYRNENHQPLYAMPHGVADRLDGIIWMIGIPLQSSGGFIGPGTECMLYQGAAHNAYLRPLDEFMDGRFEEITLEEFVRASQHEDHSSQ